MSSLQIPPHKCHIQPRPNKARFRHQHQLQLGYTSRRQARHNQWLRQLRILACCSNSLRTCILDLLEHFTSL